MFARVLQIALTTFLTMLSTGCIVTPAPKPPKPPVVVGPPAYCLAPTIHDAVTKRPLVNADIYIDVLHSVSNQDGYAYMFPVPALPPEGTNELDVYAAGYVDFKTRVPVNSWQCDFDVQMIPKHKPRPSREVTMDIKGNFLSLHDGQGRLMFSWFYPVLNAADRQVWRQAYAQAGVTHVVLDFNICYPNYWAPCADFRNNPGVVVSAVTELLDDGFIPVIMFTNGDGGTNVEVDQYWSSYVQAFRASEPCVIGESGDPCAILVPGFELVGPGGGWTSAQLSHALIVGHQLASSAIWGVEFMPERFTGSSHPVEPDDPWQGDEAGFWTSHGGEFVDVMMYEFPHGDKLLNPIGASGSACHLPGANPCGAYEDRWVEGLQRLGVGGFGWRKVAMSALEITGSDYKGGGVSDATVLRINNRILALCNLIGVSCSFGNGIPSNPQ